MLKLVLAAQVKVGKHLLHGLRGRSISHGLAHFLVQFVTQVANRLGLWKLANFCHELLAELPLTLRIFQHERIRLEVKDAVLLIWILPEFLVEVNGAPLVEVLKVHVRIAKLFLALLEGATQVALRCFGYFFVQLRETRHLSLNKIDH